MHELPIDELRSAFLSLRTERVPVVVTSPTGSGKSTRVPIWCGDAERTLVVEPRRVAARALARRVASETRTVLGEHVGYAVRDDARWSVNTRILFCTPGVALRMLGSGSLDDFGTWILDEFHERRAETDLLAALALHRGQQHRIVALSATIDAKPLAAWLGGAVLSSDGRLHPVDIEHLPAPQRTNPDDAALPLRVERALARLELVEGTVLVFLPGVGEIRETRAWLEGRTRFEILELHGQMPPEEQDRALAEPEAGTARIVLATNVAESALTVPGVVAVIDSGLERRVVRDGGLPALTLQPISKASADQRTGRAGRLRPGRCLRLWASTARLAPRNPPSIQVDEPDDWLLPLLCAGVSPEALPWLDRPLAGGLRAARDRLAEAGLWDADPWDPELPAGGRPTRAGIESAKLPLPSSLAGFCLSLRDTPAALDAAGLAAALAVGRPVLRSRPTFEQTAARRARAGGWGDAALLSRAVRLGESDARELGISVASWREARDTLERIVPPLGLDPEGWPSDFQLETVLRTWARIFPKSARTRRGAAGREEYALGGGSGWILSRDSLGWSESAPEIVLVLAHHSGEDRSGKIRTWIDAAAPLSRPDALALEVGRAEILDSSPTPDGPRCRLRRKLGDTVLGESTRLPDHPVALGRILARSRPDLDQITARLERHWRTLCAQAGRWLVPPGDALDWASREAARRIADAGPDATMALPPEADEPLLARTFPSTLPLPQGNFGVQVDALRGRILLSQEGPGKAPKVRDLALPPTWEGWTVKIA
jgi:ATP-dependent helicase HrpB